MARIAATVVVACALLGVPPAGAGEGHGKGDKKCSHSTQECLNYLAASLSGRGWVGIEMSSRENGSVEVTKVIDGSPAKNAGLRAGDVLLAVNGVRMRDPAQEAERKKIHESMKPGVVITYAVMRGGHERSAEVKLGEMPASVRHQIIGGHMAEHAEAPQDQPRS
jgi:predicted metalloprotease with PDZ domain